MGLIREMSMGLDEMCSLLRRASPVPHVAGIALRTLGRAVEVLALVDGEWRVLCSQHFCDNCDDTSIFTLADIVSAPPDLLIGVQGFVQETPVERQ